MQPRVMLGAVVLISTLAATGADATRCPGINEGYPAAARTSVSFVGTAGDAEERSDPNFLAWPFTVIAPIRGDAGAPARVELPNDVLGWCTPSFEVGCTYLIAAEPGPNGPLRITPASGGYSELTC